MSFDPTIGWGVIATVSIVFVGAIGGLYTLKANFGTVSKEFDGLRGDHQKMQDRIAATELTIARDCVKRTDLDAVESRLTVTLKSGLSEVGDRLKSMEHQTRQLDTKLSDRMLQVLTSGARRGGME